MPYTLSVLNKYLLREQRINMSLENILPRSTPKKKKKDNKISNDNEVTINLPGKCHIN